MSLFENSRVRGNVVFNFGRRAIDDLPAFAEGYHKAGKVLLHKLRNSNGYADYEGYPILFLYRHALELYIKAAVYKGAQVIGLISEQEIDCDRIFGRHRLSLFLPALGVIWREMDWDWDFGNGSLRNYEEFVAFIDELEGVDPESYTFRYPTKKNLTPAVSHHFVVNVVEFGNQTDPVLDCFSGALCGIEERMDHAVEIVHEAEQIIRDAL